MTKPPPDALARALAGRRVVVTRAAEQSAELEAMLVERGATVLVVPMIEVIAPQDGGASLAAALAAVDAYDWVVVTSPNAATRLSAALTTGRARVAAVGTATASALPSVDLVPRRQSAAGLLEVFPAGPGRVLLPHSAQARPTLADGLRALGWEVDVVPAYDVAAVSPSASSREAVRGADAVLFASGTAARAWVAGFGTERPPLVVAIGPQTAAVAEQVGLKVHLVASDHSPAGLVAMLVDHWNGP